MYFRVSPSLNLLESLNLSQFILFNDSSFENISCYYEKGILTVQSTYSKDIEGLPFTFNFDISKALLGYYVVQDHLTL